MTFLEAINTVLRRLREDAVTSSNTSDYSRLIGEFINQSIYECENAYNWHGLQENQTLVTVASTSRYSTADLVPGSTAAVKRQQILHIYNGTAGWLVKQVPAQWKSYIYSSHTHSGSVLSGSPYFWDSRNTDANGYNYINLYPVPNSVEYITVYSVAYTDEYAIDGSDDSEALRIPSMPIILNAYALAISERGEDGGIGFNEADKRFQEALSDAIALDSKNGTPAELDWNAI